jgi:hypothetical protein
MAREIIQQLNLGLIAPVLSENNRTDLLTAVGFPKPAELGTIPDPDAYLATQLPPISPTETRKIDKIREKQILSYLGDQMSYALDQLNLEPPAK